MLRKAGARSARWSLPLVPARGGVRERLLPSVSIVALFNGAQNRASPTPADDASSHQLLLILCVAELCGVGLAAAWLLLLRTARRALIWAGAGAGVLALVNGVWLLAQGGHRPRPRRRLAPRRGGLRRLRRAQSPPRRLLGDAARDGGAPRARVPGDALARPRGLPRPARLARPLELRRRRRATLRSRERRDAQRNGSRAIRRLRRNSAAQFGGAIRRRNSAGNSPTARLPPPPAGGGAPPLLSYCWTAQLIRAVVHATVAGTVGSWYFLSPRVSSNIRRRARIDARSQPRSARSASARSSPPRCRRSAPSRAACRSRAAAAAFLVLPLPTSASSTCSCASSTSLRTPRSRSTARLHARVARRAWTLLVHHSGVDALVQKDFVGSAMALGSLVGGMFTCLLVGAWARATLGVDGAAWWHARAPPPPHRTAAPAHLSRLDATSHCEARRRLPRRYSALSVVGTVVEAGATARLRLLPRIESAADARLDAMRNFHRAPARRRRSPCAARGEEAVASPSAV